MRSDQNWRLFFLKMPMYEFAREEEKTMGGKFTQYTTPIRTPTDRIGKNVNTNIKMSEALAVDMILTVNFES